MVMVDVDVSVNEGVNYGASKQAQTLLAIFRVMPSDYHPKLATRFFGASTRTVLSIF